MHTSQSPALAETSEANPASPSIPPQSTTAASRPSPVSVYVPYYAPPQSIPHPRRSTHATSTSDDTVLSGWCILLLGIISHVVCGVFIYGYTAAYANPLPRGVANQSYAGYLTFKAFMYIFEIVVGASYAYFITRCCSGLVRCSFFLVIMVVVGLFAWFIPFLVACSTARSSYAHACDSDWLQVQLNGSHARMAPNIATFSLVETGELLWTWTSSDPFENDFNLAGVNSTNPSLLPSLGNLTIDHSTNELTRAWCFNTTDQCATGYVWPFDGLFFEVQFDGMNTRMRNLYNDWSFNNVPGVIMHRVDENGHLAERLMQTHSSSRELMRVCVSHAMRRRDSVVDPDVLIAVYWLLHKQAFRVSRC